MNTVSIDIPRYLAQLPLFGELKREELERIAQGSHLMQLARGQEIFSVGQPCKEFHVVISGQIKLFALSAQGQEKIIEILGPGSSCGEALMFLERPYIISGQTLKETILLSVSHEAVMREIEGNSRFSFRMLAGLSRRLHNLINDLQAYALQNGTERVIGYLLGDLPLNGCEAIGGQKHSCVKLPVSKAAIASRLSMTPEYFSRVLHELESQGLIAIDRREITIPDPDRLTQLPWSDGAARLSVHNRHH